MCSIKSSFPALAGSQLVNLLKACLDAASVLQLRRELEDNPDLTAEDFMFIFERDFGRDCAMQAREEWAAVQLHHGGSPLTSKDWRTFHPDQGMSVFMPGIEKTDKVTPTRVAPVVSVRLIQSPSEAIPTESYPPSGSGLHTPQVHFDVPYCAPPSLLAHYPPVPPSL